MLHANREAMLAKLASINPFQNARLIQPRIPIPSHLTYGQRANSRVIKVRPVPVGKHPHHKHQQSLEQIRDVIANFKWELTDQRTPGITWIELYIIYVLHGGIDHTDKQRRNTH